jgi:N-methylhydantoinase B
VLSLEEGGVSPKGRSTVEPGEEITLLLPGGGGFGPASQRPAAAIEADIADGYVSASTTGNQAEQSGSKS